MLTKYNEHFLSEFSQKFSSYDSRQEFLKSLVKLIYDMTKLDYVLVGKAGTEAICKFLKAHKETRSIPIIMISGYPVETKAKAVGVDEFIKKPFELN